MREALLKLIAAATEAAADGETLRRTFVLQFDASFPVVWFGAGYFDHRTCLLWTDADNYEQCDPEKAVDALLANAKHASAGETGNGGGGSE